MRYYVYNYSGKKNPNGKAYHFVHLENIPSEEDIDWLEDNTFDFTTMNKYFFLIRVTHDKIETSTYVNLRNWAVHAC